MPCASSANIRIIAVGTSLGEAEEQRVDALGGEPIGLKCEGEEVAVGRDGVVGPPATYAERGTALHLLKSDDDGGVRARVRARE